MSEWFFRVMGRQRRPRLSRRSTMKVPDLIHRLVLSESDLAEMRELKAAASSCLPRDG